MASDDRVVEREIRGVRAEADLVAGGDAGAILLHGLASERRALGPLPDVLAEQGFTVVAPDLIGHGASDGPRGVLERGRILDELRAWRATLDEAGASLDVLAGHSLGGLWALYAAPELEPTAVAAIASPASVRDELSAIELFGYRIGGAVDRWVRRVGGPSLRVPYQVDLEDVLDDEDAIERARRISLLQETIPLVNVPELLAVDGPAWARRVDQPTLVVYADRDRLVAREGTRRLHDALPGERTWLGLEGPHSLFLDARGEACAEQVADWMREHVEPSLASPS